jgi:hypothetical protein
VIPEYEYRVAARLQAHHGNGLFNRFFGPSDGPQVFDPVTGGPVYPLTEQALDRNRVYQLTYGHAFFMQSNGPVPNNYMLEIDMIREYYLGSALQRLYLESAVRSIEYRSGTAWRTFEERLAEAGTTDAFIDPQLRIEFENGLVMFLNHAAGEDTGGWVEAWDGDSFRLPEDGFLAYLPGTPFLAFSASVVADGEERFDYCRAPGRYEFFDGRGAVAGFGGLSTETTSGTIARGLAVESLAANVRLLERPNGQLLSEPLGPEPEVVAIEVEPATLTVQPGRRVGMRAVARLSNGGVRDVTTLVEWRSSDPDVAVTEGPAVLGCRPGVARIEPEPLEGVEVAPGSVTVRAD